MNSSNIPTDKACSAIINVQVGLKKPTCDDSAHDTTGQRSYCVASRTVYKLLLQ